MAIREIKNKERLNGMKYCTFCKPDRIDAIWRDSRLNFACEKHKAQLSGDIDDGHRTEADYQTWMRL